MTQLRDVPRWALLGVLLTSACKPAVVRRDSGVAVGNPGNLRMSIAPVDGARFVDGEALIGSLSLEGCNGVWTDVGTDLVMLLDGQTPIEVPRGEWCGVALHDVLVDTDVEVDATRYAPPTLEIWSIDLYGKAGSNPGDDLAVWLGSPDWSTQRELSVWYLDRDSAAANELADVLADESLLVVDRLGDGADDGDRVVGWNDGEDDHTDADLDDQQALTRESGCGTEEETFEGFLLLALGLGWGRRRKRGGPNSALSHRRGL